MLNHRIQYYEQFTHTSCDGYLFKFSSIHQPLIELPDYRIKSDSYQSGHVQSPPDCSTPSPDSSFTTQVSTITIKWRYAGKSCYLSSIQFPQLRQIPP